MGVQEGEGHAHAGNVAQGVVPHAQQRAPQAEHGEAKGALNDHSAWECENIHLLGRVVGGLAVGEHGHPEGAQAANAEAHAAVAIFLHAEHRVRKICCVLGIGIILRLRAGHLPVKAVEGCLLLKPNQQVRQLQLPLDV